MATLAPAGSEISTFLRCYLYEPGDASKPHFDRSFREHGVSQATSGRGAGRGPLLRFSAFSLLMYLTDSFGGGHTTFFEPDDGISVSRRGLTPLCDRASVRAPQTP